MTRASRPSGYGAPRIVNAALSGFLLLMPGCGSIGPERLTDSHEGYNDAVQLTISREVLKNIVRKRYSDPMQFIAVSTINAQFSVNAGANIGVSGIGTTGPAGSTGANIGYSESPTITFVPQSDASFNKSIDAPIELQEAMVFLNIVSSFRPDEIGFVVAAVNDAPDRPGRAGLAYRRRIEALARLFENGASLQHFREFYPRHAPIPADRVDGRAYVDAAKADLYFYKAGGGRLNLASKHLGIGLVIPSEATADPRGDLRTLGLRPGKRLYPMRSPRRGRARAVRPGPGHDLARAAKRGGHDGTGGPRCGTARQSQGRRYPARRTTGRKRERQSCSSYRVLSDRASCALSHPAPGRVVLHRRYRYGFQTSLLDDCRSLCRPNRFKICL